MRIDAIELFRLPLAPAPHGDPTKALQCVLAAITSDGLVGWGEVTLGAAPIQDEQWSAGAFACLRDWLAPALVGKDVHSGEALAKALAHFAGNRQAKAVLDFAWHDLAARRASVPLYQLLGGRRTAIPLSACLGVTESIDALLSAIGEALAGGYEWITLALQPGWDVQVLRAVRQAHPATAISVDCGGRCSLEGRELFYRLEDFHLDAIEQPLAVDDLVGHAMLQESLRTPIGLHQSITSLDRAEQAIDLGSCRQVRIEPALVGGLWPALAIRAACEAAQIPCGLGATAQAALATRSQIALATLPNFSLPADSFAELAAPWATADAAGGATSQGNPARRAYVLPDTAGAGVTIDSDLAARHAIEHATIR